MLVSTPAGVFFNPIQRLQRDLTIEVVKQFLLDSRGVVDAVILDGMAGCGTRAIRYALEIKRVGRVVANDISAEAATAMKDNVAASYEEASFVDFGPLPTFDIVQGDLRDLLVSSIGTFDVIDIDPCGSPAPFISLALRALKSGGLLCLACTDFQDLSGGRGGEAASRSFSRYSSWVGTTGVSSAAIIAEVALRSVLHCVEVAAGAMGRRIEVVTCASLEFNLRIIVRVSNSEQHLGPLPIIMYQTSNSFHVKTLGSDGHEPGVNGCAAEDGELLGPMHGSPCLSDCDFLNRIIARIHGRKCAQNVRVLFGEPSMDFSDLAKSPATLFCSAPENESEERPRLEAACERFERILHNLDDDIMPAQHALRWALEKLHTESTVHSLFSYSVSTIAQHFSTSSGAEPIPARDINVAHVCSHLISMGYAAAPTYVDSRNSFKSDAPFSVICEATSLSVGTLKKHGGQSILQAARTASEGDGSPLGENNTFFRSDERASNSLMLQTYGRVHASPPTSLGTTESIEYSRVKASFPCTTCILRSCTLSRHSRVFIVGENEKSGAGGAPASEICYPSLDEAVRASSEGEHIVVPSGTHLVPSCGIAIATNGIRITGCPHQGGPVVIALSTQDSGDRRPSGATSQGAVFLVVAKDVEFEEMTVEASFSNAPSIKRKRGHGQKSSGQAPQWCSIAVEGDGNSAITKRCSCRVREGEKVPLAKGKGGVMGKGKFGRGKGGKGGKGGSDRNSGDGAGVVVASKCSFRATHLCVSGGFGTGILVCGRASATIVDSNVSATLSCGILVQSGGEMSAKVAWFVPCTSYFEHD